MVTNMALITSSNVFAGCKNPLGSEVLGFNDCWFAVFCSGDRARLDLLGESAAGVGSDSLHGQGFAIR